MRITLIFILFLYIILFVLPIHICVILYIVGFIFIVLLINPSNANISNRFRTNRIRMVQNKYHPIVIYIMPITDEPVQYAKPIHTKH